MHLPREESVNTNAMNKSIKLSEIIHIYYLNVRYTLLITELYIQIKMLAKIHICYIQHEHFTLK